MGVLYYFKFRKAKQQFFLSDVGEVDSDCDIVRCDIDVGDCSLAKSLVTNAHACLYACL